MNNTIQIFGSFMAIVYNKLNKCREEHEFSKVEGLRCRYRSGSSHKKKRKNSYLSNGCPNHHETFTDCLHLHCVSMATKPVRVTCPEIAKVRSRKVVPEELQVRSLVAVLKQGNILNILPSAFSYPAAWGAGFSDT